VALPFSTLTRFLDALSNDQALDKRVAAFDGPAVTALPANPRDGQLTVYRAATDVAWLLKYDASITDAYKWRALAGPPLVVSGYGTNLTVTAASTWQDGSSLMRVLAPLAGLYDLQGGAMNYAPPAANTLGQVGFALNGAATPSDPIGIATVQGGLLVHVDRATVTAAGGDVRLKWYSASTATVFRDRFMSVLPVRVG
jgi:hypothetical protein